MSKRLSSELLVVSAWALLGAMLLSTQFLVQPFVWSHFTVEDITAAWLVIARNRLIVTTSIALAIFAALSFAPLPHVPRWAVVGIAIVAGAFAGESMLCALDYEHAPVASPAMLVRVGRWVTVALAIGSIVLFHRRAGQVRAQAHFAQLRAVQIERRAVESRLQLLRAQIEPHFLFNTLATIRHLHRATPALGASMLDDFIDYLRAAIPKARGDDALIRDELALVRAYLGLVAVRMSGRLDWTIECEPGVGDAHVPPLVIATLVENAVKHGIVPAEEGGRVDVTARRAGSGIEIVVIDTGVGLQVSGGGTGIGLSNTRARLASRYGPEAGVELTRHLPRGVCAMLRIPGPTIRRA